MQPTRHDWVLSLRGRQTVEQPKLTQHGMEYAADGLSSLSTRALTGDEHYDIFFEAFYLFVTSVQVNISARPDNRSP